MSEIQELPELRVDRTKIKVVVNFDNSEEIEYWRNTSYEERLEQLERLRRIAYGDKATARLQRSIQFIER